MKSDDALHILIVDDSDEDRELYRRLLLRSRDGNVIFSEAATAEEGLDLYRSGHADCVLLDYQLPDLDGLDFLSELIADRADVAIPIVMLTGQGSDAIAMEAMRRGAQDYLVKGQIKREVLDRTIRYAIERQRLQTELEKRARHQLELKNQFLSHVSHELRSPLTVVYQFVTLVLDGLAGETNPEQREYLQTALRNVHQLQGMIDDLLEATRADTGKLSVSPERAAIGPIAEEVVASMQTTATDRCVTLTFSTEDDLPAACADPSRIRQVLLNVVDNAIKFTPEKGSVEVAVSQYDEHMIRVCVKDTGCGISAESRERIFDRLHQEETIVEASRKGLGLGLYICKELVSRHGGTMWAESGDGRGSVVSFTVPVFSLARLIGPTVTDEQRLRESISLVSAHLLDASGVTSEELGDAIASEVTSVIQACTLPDLDLLLPTLTHTPNVRSFFVIACTDGVGAQVLAARLRGQLERSVTLQGIHVRAVVTSRQIYLSDKRETADESAIRAIVAKIESAVEREADEAADMLRESEAA